MVKLRKILMVIERGTSLIREVFRFEIPVIKAGLPPSEKFALRDMQQAQIRDEHVGSFDAKTAYLYLRQNYPDALVSAVYPNLSTFEPDFEAVKSRDTVGDVSKLDKEVDNNEAKLKVLALLEKIDGVGTALAPVFFEAGFDSIESVAASSLDELEAIKGVGPASAVQIKDSATLILKGVLDAKPDPTADNPFQQ